jgi:hypothetical protein
MSSLVLSNSVRWSSARLHDRPGWKELNARKIEPLAKLYSKCRGQVPETCLGLSHDTGSVFHAGRLWPSIIGIHTCTICLVEQI